MLSEAFELMSKEQLHPAMLTWTELQVSLKTLFLCCSARVAPPYNSALFGYLVF
jgi:hypothetical protein